MAGFKLATRIDALRPGWPRRLLAFGAGALSVFAMAPFFVWPVFALTLPVLVLLIDARQADPMLPRPLGRLEALFEHPAMRAAVIAWWFGFGYFFAGLFWVAEAFLVEAEKFAIFIPLAVTAMPAGLALFWAAAAAAASFLWRPGLGRIVALAITLSIAEWLRGHVLTGFPWNVLGYALTWPLPLMQSAALVGVYGLTLVAIPVLACPLVLYCDGKAGRVSDRQWRIALAASALTLGVMAAWGAWRSTIRDESATGAPKIRVVQPSIPQREKWRPENQERIFNEHLELSLTSPNGEPDAAKGVRLILWPEAAMPFLPLRQPAALAAIGRMLPEGAHLVSGALRLDEPAADKPGDRRRVYNSLLAFGAGGQLVATYDKIHLVPFGEYLPLQSLLESIGLEQLTRMRGGFDIGVRPRPLLDIPGLPKFGPLICYEAIFPATLVQGGERPAALLNVTNDGWFGNTTGPRQHFHQARVRAVEEGLPVFRAANNGISAIVDARGRVQARLDMNAKGVIDASLPPALTPPLYARVGDWLFFMLLVVAGLGLVVLARRSPRS